MPTVSGCRTSIVMSEHGAGNWLEWQGRHARTALGRLGAQTPELDPGDRQVHWFIGRDPWTKSTKQRQRELSRQEKKKTAGKQKKKEGREDEAPTIKTKKHTWRSRSGKRGRSDRGRSSRLCALEHRRRVCCGVRPRTRWRCRNFRAPLAGSRRPAITLRDGANGLDARPTVRAGWGRVSSVRHVWDWLAWPNCRRNWR